MAIRSPMAPLMGELSAKLTALSAPSGGTSPKGRGLQSADCHASDIGHWLAMTAIFGTFSWGKRIATPVCELARNDNQ